MTDFVSVNYLNWMCLVTMGFENSDLLAYMIKNPFQWEQGFKWKKSCKSVTWLGFSLFPLSCIIQDKVTSIMTFSDMANV